MSFAAVDLQTTDAKIIDIAEKYGYHSPTAFNRAFQGIHGIAPSCARDAGVSVKSFPPITFKITVKGVEEMKYRIEKKDAFALSAYLRRFTKKLRATFPLFQKCGRTQL